MATLNASDPTSQTCGWYASLDLPALLILAVVTVGGLTNWLVLVVLAVNSKLHVAYNLIVAAMTIVDLTTSILVAPWDLYNILSGHKSESGKYCEAITLLRITSLIISLMFILVITMHRALQRTQRTFVRLNVIIWLMVCVFCYTIGLGMGWLDRIDGGSCFSCSQVVEDREGINSTSLVVNTFMVVAMILVYIIMWLESSLCCSCAHPTTHEEEDYVVLSHRVTISVTFFVIASCIATLLHRIIWQLDYHAEVLIHACTYVHAAIKPLLYIFQNGDARFAAKEVLPQLRFSTRRRNVIKPELSEVTGGGAEELSTFASHTCSELAGISVVSSTFNDIVKYGHSNSVKSVRFAEALQYLPDAFPCSPTPQSLQVSQFTQYRQSPYPRRGGIRYTGYEGFSSSGSDSALSNWSIFRY